MKSALKPMMRSILRRMIQMNSNSHRLNKGGLINRQAPLKFKFNGQNYTGFDGDTLASALLANGVSLSARSFKYHRPRGIVGAWTEEPSCIVELDGVDQSGNHAVTTVKLKNGLSARSVNCWPSPAVDAMSVLQWFSPLLPAAFYYKTFKWPDWHWFEPTIRRAAGLAAAPQLAEIEEHYEIRHGHCDVLVVGAGPAGLLSALMAKRSGLRVILVDDGFAAGGSLLSTTMSENNSAVQSWVNEVLSELRDSDLVTVLLNSVAWAYREHNLVIVTEREPNFAQQSRAHDRRTWRIRAGQVIVAAGAIERMLVFANNDRPGVMLCSAVRSYINRYAVAPGRRLVLFTNNSSAYETAAEFLGKGINIVAIVDARKQVSSSERALAKGVEVLVEHEIANVFGRKRVKGVLVRHQTSGDSKKMVCDLLCVSGGWSPTSHLFSQSRGNLNYDQAKAAFVPGESVQSVVCVGAAAGDFEFDSLLGDTISKVKRLLNDSALNTDIDNPIIPEVENSLPYDIAPMWLVKPKKNTDKAFVDLQNDVTSNDVALAIREGFGAVEHVKRYTTAGMGIDQGRTGNVNVIGIIAEQAGASIEGIGTTTFRSPFVPVEFGAMVGFRTGPVALPYRHTPITQWNKDQGACMYESGARWRRPGFYPEGQEQFQDTVNRESQAVRSGVGVYDGSPLGKFEIKGPDALSLLNMLYTISFNGLEVKRGRYGIMLSDDGLIFDDGVCFRLAENHYLMTTSTAHADDVNRHIEHFLQIERPDWRVHITPVTSQWCNATLCGPLAREVMQALGCSMDVSNSAFEFMSLREGTVAGIAARVCRVSFTGELSFEINVAPRDFLELWEKIIDVGKAFNLVPIGSEANHVLRVEKGFLSLGHEADGTTDPFDLGMGWIMSDDKADFIGKRAVAIRRKSQEPRRELVGLLSEDPNKLIPENTPLTLGGDSVPSEGLVTASVWSVVNERVVSLALLKNGRARHGEVVHARVKDEIIKATVTSPCFHDPYGKLLKS